MLVTKHFADKGHNKDFWTSFLSPTTMFISRAIGRVATSAFRAPATRLATKPLGVQAANKGNRRKRKNKKRHAIGSYWHALFLPSNQARAYASEAQSAGQIR